MTPKFTGGLEFNNGSATLPLVRVPIDYVCADGNTYISQPMIEEYHTNWGNWWIVFAISLGISFALSVIICCCNRHRLRAIQEERLNNPMTSPDESNLNTGFVQARKGISKKLSCYYSTIGYLILFAVVLIIVSLSSKDTELSV